MKKIYSYICFLVLLSNLFSQDIYTLLGFRINNIKPNVEVQSALDDLLFSSYFNSTYGYGQIVMNEKYNNNKYDYIKKGNSWFIGGGYRHFIRSNPNLYSNFTFKYNEESASVYVIDGSDLDFTAFSDLIDSGQEFQTVDAMIDQSSVEWQKLYSTSMSLGVGFGYMWDNGLALELGADYILYPYEGMYSDFNTFPSENYMTYNLKVSYTFGSKRNNMWTAPLGVHISKPSNTRFMHSPLFDSINSSPTDIALELPAGYGIVAGAIFYFAALIEGAGSGYDYSGSGYAWDAFYDQYGNIQWRCRDKSNGEFAYDSNCSGLVKSDNTWPGK